MFKSAPKSALTEDDRLWLLEQMGQIACAFAYAHNDRFGDRVAVNIEHLPEFRAHGIALMRDGE
ncbi:MAG: hypothetical protein EOO77_32175 [Oxalobacteraceae bacterium]|jgi:hypothetical protein|nr:MAG: hypothetical protein EOO77_32175 [Oxalobacteraceae bacterium]